MSREVVIQAGRSGLESVTAIAATLVVAVFVFSLGATPTAAAPGGGPFVVKLGGAIENDLPDTDPDPGNDDGICSTVNSPPEDPKPANANTCTLRAAIDNANHDPDPSTIEFALTDPIELSGYLPDLMHPVTIDGWTQSGANPGAGLIPQPAVRIDGTQLQRHTCQDPDGQVILEQGNTGYGFVVFGANSMIRGLNIFGFPCDDIVVYNAPLTRISGNYIGTNANGTAIDTSLDPSPIKDGIYVHSSPGTTIGGLTPAEGNVATSPTEHGILVAGNSNGVVVRHNKVGVNPAGGATTEAPGRMPWSGIVVVRLEGQATPLDQPVIADNQVAGMNPAAHKPAGIVVGAGVSRRRS